MKKWYSIGLLLLVVASFGIVIFLNGSSPKSSVSAEQTLGTQPRENADTRVAEAPTTTPEPEKRAVGESTTREGSRRMSAPDFSHNEVSGKSPANTNAVGPKGSAKSPATSTGQPREREVGREIPPAFALMRVFGGIGRLEEEGSKTPLTSAQAKAILAIVTPLRKQQSLTPEQAQKTVDALEAQLTEAQREAIKQQRRGGRRGQGNGGERRPERAEGAAPTRERAPGVIEGAPPRERVPGETAERERPEGERPAGARPTGPPAWMENMNPFNPSTENPMAERINERWSKIYTALEAKAAK